ncbi:hypothetical protein PMAYCL1PPCAC_32290 [Pristionchus mayeri]|uniref:F-box domain-containing protein n=1 Tax=Pristionchus mayeri TaxID=1317129 RepID=A0AAN5DH72_9BILA|nr:hypothetical protein PMAYCL1PPCAC_32290 [Pristionchus mayeri]
MEVDATQSADLSPIEQLPQEIQWAIFGFTPQSLFDLRLTSQAMRGRVDQFATQPTMTCIRVALELEELANNSGRNGVDGRSEVRNALKMHVNDQIAKLIELRFILFMPFRERPFEIRKETGQAMQSYKWELGNRDNHKENSNFLKACFGDIIEQVKIKAEVSSTQSFFEEASILLDPFQIETLDVKAHYIEDERAGCLKKIVKNHGIDKLSLAIGFSGFRKIKPVEFLLCLASEVRSIKVVQDIPRDAEPMHPPNWIRFGYEFDVDWSGLILGMLSRKVDTLDMNSLWVPGSEIVDELVRVRFELFILGVVTITMILRSAMDIWFSVSENLMWE